MPFPKNHFRGSIAVNISARHAEDLGSIPGRGVLSSPGLAAAMAVHLARLAATANAYILVHRPPVYHGAWTPGFNATSAKSTILRGSIVVSISARHAEDPGSIPGRGASRDCEDRTQGALQ